MAHLGLVGIGVMGGAFAQNLAEKGHDVSMLDRTDHKMTAVVKSAGRQKLSGALYPFTDPKSFVASLPTPRSILVLVPAGAALDSVIETLTPHLSKGDLIADLGNSYYGDTQNRVARLEAQQLKFLGMGISGGAQGARNGPSIMAGGSKDSWARVETPLKDAAAKFEGTSCCDWFGPGGAGHFIKMLHNGIEYADMQLIAEAYGVMRDGAGMETNEIGHVFQKWMNGPLNSYLIEIAGEVALAQDDQTGQPMLDIILDKAGQKGTGRWSVIEALHLGAPVSMVSVAVEARNISADMETRQAMVTGFGDISKADRLLPVEKEALVSQLHDGVLAAKIGAYVQGFEVLKRASETFKWDLDLAAIARVWRAGCIIRSVFLDEIADVFDKDGSSNLSLAPVFEERLKQTVPALRDLVSICVAKDLSVPALYSALEFHNAQSTSRSTANMIQGLRDYFGAHGFERRDSLGQKTNGPWHS